MMNKKVQEAWDIVAEYLAKEHPMYAASYFVSESGTIDGKYIGKLHLHSDREDIILVSSKKYDTMKGEKK